MTQSTVDVYLFRHGETDWNAEKRIQGHTDIPLNANGRLQAQELADRLARHDIQAIVSSDLARARETAAVVAQRLGVPVFTDARLRETSLGEVEGLLIDEVIARFGDAAWQRWRSMDQDHLDFGFPGGESKRTALKRAWAALTAFIDGHAFERIAVATHGTVLRTLAHSLLPAGAPLTPVNNCAVHRIEYTRTTNRDVRS